MAWNDIPDRKCITFNDIAESGISLKTGAHLYSNRNITKSELTTQYDIIETQLNVLASNQLVPRILVRNCAIGNIIAIDEYVIKYYAYNTGPFTKSTCSVHKYPEPKTYTKSYMSEISQTDANNIATANYNQFLLDGQTNAEIFGTCADYKYKINNLMTLAFYPSQADGVNDVLHIWKYKDAEIAEPPTPTLDYSLFPNMYFKVTTQSGNFQFESTGVYVPWNGKKADGSKVQEGAYYVYFYFNDGSGKQIANTVTVVWD